ncbi:P-loop containing nucleoside triphosphate hydrolase protein [Cercophora scortea]|uniref:Cell division control protein n=1 Tax=Cercophora scortea TaxID=314031 RepID=A0AAE0MLZ1_9PEZI|nr:P-loop containing nucleoside triphosphate hydrolase protein [Cercophora scortea]
MSSTIPSLQTTNSFLLEHIVVSPSATSSVIASRQLLLPHRSPMASTTTTLGKRTRSSRFISEPESESSLELLPPKRTRRVRNAAGILEDRCNTTTTTTTTSTKSPAHRIEDQENQRPQPDRDANAPLGLSPSKSQTKRVSVSNTIRSPSKAPVTPSTPRHYDVFAKPTTPRHRVSVGKFSRRMTPQTPLTPASYQTVYHQARQLFSRSNDPGQLIGRSAERTQLKGFLGRCATAHPGGCLYVSGPPGTGKSALVNEVTQEVSSENASIRRAYINCMSIKSSKDLYLTLFDQLSGETEMSESDVVAALEKLFMPKKKPDQIFLIVLDEVDHIMTLDLESLYRVLEWSLQKNSRLALVGIANALDLTDRFLPRLKSRNLKPELLPILPYTAPQVKQIITTRLKSLLPPNTADPNFIPFFHPAAIELCSRKVSTQTGDLRRAFEVCRRAIDLVENETRLKHEGEIKEQLLQMSPTRKVLGENHNLASGPTSSSSSSSAGPSSVSASLIKSLQTLTVENAPRVTIAHLNKVTAAAFSNGTSQRLKTLNLQQKAALCSLLAIEKRNRAAQSSAAAAAASQQAAPTTPSSSRSAQVTAPTVKTLFETYSVLCTRDSVLHPLSSSEFREVVGSLETLSLTTAVDGKTGSFAVLQTPGGGRKRRKDIFAGVHGLADEKRVASCVGESEMEGALEGPGVGILRSILSGDALD